MSKKAVVLLSGGLDSTVNLYWAHQEMSEVYALTINYGQKALEKEMSWARFHCERLGIAHQVIRVPDIFSGTESSLVNPGADIPQSEVDIDSLSTSQETAKSVWVPNRNGLFLNIAACIAEKLKADFVIPGFNKEEAETFPDNSQGFIEAMNQSLEFSTLNRVKVHCFTTDLFKADIMKKAREFDIDPDHLWPCYYAGETPCGQCESCQRFERAKQC